MAKHLLVQVQPQGFLIIPTSILLLFGMSLSNYTLGTNPSARQNAKDLLWCQSPSIGEASRFPFKWLRIVWESCSSLICPPQITQLAWTDSQKSRLGLGAIRLGKIIWIPVRTSSTPATATSSSAWRGSRPRSRTSASEEWSGWSWRWASGPRTVMVMVAQVADYFGRKS